MAPRKYGVEELILRVIVFLKLSGRCHVDVSGCDDLVATTTRVGLRLRGFVEGGLLCVRVACLRRRVWVACPLLCVTKTVTLRVGAQRRTWVSQIDKFTGRGVRCD